MPTGDRCDHKVARDFADLAQLTRRIGLPRKTMASVRRCSIATLMGLALTIGQAGNARAQDAAHTSFVSVRPSLTRLVREPPRLITLGLVSGARKSSVAGAMQQTSLKQCHSKKTGAIVGVIAGAAAGVALGVYVSRSASEGVLGTGPGGRRMVLYTTTAGAGAGALAGVAYCR